MRVAALPDVFNAAGRQRSSRADRGHGGKVFSGIHTVIRGIKKGRIKTYGEVAQQAAVSVRTVVWALKSCPPDVPWHRVLGKGGRILLASRSPRLGARQAHLLSQEGWQVSNWTVSRRPSPKKARNKRKN